MVAPRSCKAVRRTRPATCSRREKHSSPSAARPGGRRTWRHSRWSTATPSPAGGSVTRARGAMSMREMVALATGLAPGLSVAHAADALRFGQPITPADLAPWDISIAPDGVGLPPGSGTSAQGAKVYADHGCALCHGEKGSG